MTMEDQPNAVREDESSDDDDMEDGTYKMSLQALPHGKGLTSASGSGAARDDEEIVEEEEGNDGAEGDNDEGNEDVFDVDEINPTSYIHMKTLVFWLPLNSDWREKISCKGKIDFVREKRKKI
jgi:hypothetical protein